MFGKDKFRKKYYKTRKIDFKRYLNDKDFEILRKIGIELEDKLYTEYEFECITIELVKYLYMTKLDIKIILEGDLKDFLEELDVTPEELEIVKSKLDEFYQIYGI